MKAEAELSNDKVIVFDQANASRIHSKGYLGNLINAKLELNFLETIYLIRKEKIDVFFKKKLLNEKDIIKKALKLDKNFNTKYVVFEKLKKQGFVIKTALKYGFDFRIYEKGVKPGQEHAIWLVNCYGEHESFSWKDFSKIMRISHSVRKKAMIAVVDDESDVTFWESEWKKI